MLRLEPFRNIGDERRDRAGSGNDQFVGWRFRGRGFLAPCERREDRQENNNEVRERLEYHFRLDDFFLAGKESWQHPRSKAFPAVVFPTS